MSINQDLEVEAHELVEKIKREEKEDNPWNDKSDAFDFLEKYHEKMLGLLIKFGSRYNSEYEFEKQEDVKCKCDSCKWKNGVYSSKDWCRIYADYMPFCIDFKES